MPYFSDDNRRLPNTNLACNDMKIMYVYDITVTCHVGLLGKRNVRHCIWCPKMTPAIEHLCSALPAGWKTWRIDSLCLKLSASYISSGYFKSSCPLSTRLYPTYLRILEAIFLEQLLNFKRTFKLLCWKCKRWLLTCKASQTRQFGEKYFFLCWNRGTNFWNTL